MSRKSLRARELLQKNGRIRPLAQPFVQNRAGLVELLLVQHRRWPARQRPAHRPRRDSLLRISMACGKSLSASARNPICTCGSASWGKSLISRVNTPRAVSPSPHTDQAAGVKQPGTPVVGLGTQNLTGLLHGLLRPMLHQTDFGQFIARRNQIGALVDGLQKLAARIFPSLLSAGKRGPTASAEEASLGFWLDSVWNSRTMTPACSGLPLSSKRSACKRRMALSFGFWRWNCSARRMASSFFPCLSRARTFLTW